METSRRSGPLFNSAAILVYFLYEIALKEQG